MKKFISILLSVCMLSALAITASAGEISASGTSGSTPVYLSSTDDGTLDGNPAATAMSVTVPTSFPMAMSQTGDVTCATDCEIVNLSYGAVRVKTVTVTAAKNWHLTAFGDKSTLASEKVDSNKIGFSMTMGSKAVLSTDGSDAQSQTLLRAPAAGCYMSGVGNLNANKLAVTYDAIITPLSKPVTNTAVASVVFVVEWDTAA